MADLLNYIELTQLK